MSDEEKQAIEKFKNFIYTYQEVIEDEYSDYEEKESAKEYQEVSGKLLKLIEKQQKEIEKRLKEIDSLYKMMSVKDDKIEQMKEEYQILKDDIEGHNIVYVDTPEFEENYISKNKIKEKIEKIKEDEEFYRERDRMYEFDGKINILKELLGE